MYAQLQQLAEAERVSRNNENHTLIGDNIEILKDAFQESKDAGKPWQIWAANSKYSLLNLISVALASLCYSLLLLLPFQAMMGHYVLPEPNKFHLAAPTIEGQAVVKGYFDALMAIQDAGATVRTLQALALTDLEWNQDDFSGFHYERTTILAMLAESANNPIVLGGDLHDSFAWVLFEGGNSSGNPVAVNLGCPGVTSPGFGPLFSPVFASIQDAVGGEGGFYKVAADTYTMTNPGLKYVDVQHKGFVAAVATKVRIPRGYRHSINHVNKWLLTV